MRILVTGGCGFIGSNYIRYHLKEHEDDEIVNVDKLTYAGNPENLSDLSGNGRYRFVKADITDGNTMEPLISEGFDLLVNFAAESHVDRAIEDPAPFLTTNVNGTQTLLEISRKHLKGRFLQISTDEVYGSLGPEGHFTEKTPLQPNSPYSASKASADLLVRAYHETYKMDVVTTRCSNNYGPFQFPEKLLPLFITNAMDDIPLPIYGDGLNVRDWLHVEDHCRAIDRVALEGKAGEVYNIGGNCEMTNIEMTDKILTMLEKPESLKTYVEDRKGHDRRYAIDPSKIRDRLGWEPRWTLEKGLKETISWYRENRQWWERIKSGAYRDE